jgi:4,5-dihydroxyphthalate decarboxylase
VTRLELSMALTPNPRTQPLLDGAIEVEGVSYIPTRSHPSELFYRQLRFGEFDVSEMSLASLAIAHDRGLNQWWALPVFTTRHFFHTNAWVRRDAGIERPEDLRGKRVGVPEYQQTAAVWARGALLHEFGVEPRQIEWHMERTESLSHGAATGFRPPAGLSFHRIATNQSIGTMLLSGQLDATLLYIGANLVDRSRERLEGRPEVRRLFPDPLAEGQRYFRKTGIYPANHCVVVRRSLVERHPWLPVNVFDALQRAKQLAAARLVTLTEGHRQLGLLPAGAVEGLEQDPYPYGMEANRSMLTTLTGYLHEQELTSRVVALEELFAASTMSI